MDRSFQKVGFPQSPFGRNKKVETPSSFRKNSRWSVSGKSTQSVQVIFKTQHNYVERFGQPIPVLVTEALTFADRNTVVSAGISENGYAWVVCGRRLLIWQYKQSSGASGTPQRKHGGANFCYELQLPQSDLAHRAELVNVFIPSLGSSYIPACIAASPEGLIRYWPTVSHEDVSYEQTIDLQGQECDSLTDVEGLGCILATTTCSVILITPQSGVRHMLNCCPLKTPTGWLGGLSKRMSSLFFGPISAEQQQTRLVRVHSFSNPDGTWTVFVLAGNSLQKWKLTSNTENNEELVYVTELNRIVKDHFHATFWENCIGDNEIDMWILDLQHDNADNLILLTAAVNMVVSPQIHYVLVYIQASSQTPPVSVREFHVLKISGLYCEENPSPDTLSYKFLWCNNNVYLFNQKSVTIIRTQEEPDVIEFNSQDLILGGSICVNIPIFFTKNNGLVSVTNNDLMELNMNGTLNTTLDQSISANDVTNSNLSLYHLDPLEIYNTYTDTFGQMKSAFIFHLKNDFSACMDIINELFPIDVESIRSVDGVLDKIVISTCEELLNDKPACDPRWSNDVSRGIGSSYSMQLANQLDDKFRAFNIYIKFLREVKLWDRLAACTIRGTIQATVHVLGEFTEKIVAAIRLKSMESDEILDKAISEAVKDVQFDREFGLTAQDVFYRKIVDIHKGLQALVNNCSEVVHSDLHPTEVTHIINRSNDIIISVLNEVLQHRKLNVTEHFKPSATALQLAPDYLPWTSINGTEGLMDHLWEQHEHTANHALKYTNNKQMKSNVTRQLVALIDIILDARKCHIQSIRGSHRGDLHYKQFCVDRRKLIVPLIQEKEYESALLVAEKFLDFESLVEVCELTDNQRRLDEYMSRFDNENFTQFLYNWYIRENKQSKLLERCRKLDSRNSQKLIGFLSQHPQLLWMQQIHDNSFNHAASTLLALSESETSSLTKQKTLFSLAKLSKLAAESPRDADSFVDNVNSRLELIAYQEELPDYVLQNFGYNVNNPCVIPPKDLISLYICEEYRDSSECDFKKAVDLLEYIDDEELKEEMRLKIWRQALMKDEWTFGNLDAPIEILQETTFFKTADLAISMGCDAEELLPPIEELLNDPELDTLKSNKSFLYLIKTGYEHIKKLALDM